MAIALDATSSGTGAASPFNVSHTISGSDRVLIVLVMSTDGITVTSVTYNGVAMTLIASRDNASEMSGRVYGLLAPATGTHNITVTTDAPTACTVFAASFTGASGYDASASASGNNSSSADASVTVATNRSIGFVVSGGVANGATQTLTYSGAGTEIANIDDNSNSLRGAAAYKSFTGGSDITHTWTKGTNPAKWCAIGAEVYELSNVAPKPLIMRQAVKRASFY